MSMGIEHEARLLRIQPGYWLDYLLRSHKGQFYRKRYPSLSVI